MAADQYHVEVELMAVHVFAEKDHPEIDGPEFYCTTATPYSDALGLDDGDGVPVIYHGQAEQRGGVWHCPACGVDSA
jgi:hypothetical protein